jgi:hypothetical protein
MQDTCKRYMRHVSSEVIKIHAEYIYGLRNME